MVHPMSWRVVFRPHLFYADMVSGDQGGFCYQIRHHGSSNDLESGPNIHHLWHRGDYTGLLYTLHDHIFGPHGNWSGPHVHMEVGYQPFDVDRVPGHIWIGNWIWNAATVRSNHRFSEHSHANSHAQPHRRPNSGSSGGCSNCNNSDYIHSDIWGSSFYLRGPKHLHQSLGIQPS